ncbi:MAG: hypothetical protein RLZZ241_2080 [Bacteroidota bacterium]|jgi:hypothetical protein
MNLKKISLFGLILPLASLLTSCEFSEEINLNANGSGDIALNFDGSAFMEMASDMSDGPKEQAVDTVIYFADILREAKDSIAHLPEVEQEKFRQLAPYRMQMHTDPEAKEMTMRLSRDFDRIEEIEDALKAFRQTGILEKDTDANKMSDFGATTSTTYGFTDGIFFRKSTITDSVLHRQRIDSLGQGASFFESTAYIIKINFPRPIAKATGDGNEISPDRKTLVRQVNFMEYMIHPEVLDVEVILED